MSHPVVLGVLHPVVVGVLHPVGGVLHPTVLGLLCGSPSDCCGAVAPRSVVGLRLQTSVLGRCGDPASLWVLLHLPQSPGCGYPLTSHHGAIASTEQHADQCNLRR